MTDSTTQKDKAPAEAGDFALSPRSLFNMELRPEDTEVFSYLRKAYRQKTETGRILTKADTVRRAMKREAVRLGYKLRV